MAQAKAEKPAAEQADNHLASPRGAIWHRWDPHIHAPGTVLNDQYKGDDPWEDFLSRVESSSPVIRALGITDYYCLDVYENVLRARADGRLQDVGLIFPNVEMRLAVGTVKGRWANIHLLVSPEDPDHIDELKRFLGRLTFSAHGDTFSCQREELIRLGHKSDTSIKEQHVALSYGAEQFKVTFDQLKDEYRASDWAKENILIGVAGSETDGTSGIREGADATLRQEIEKFAHVILSSSPSQRDFWLGRKAASIQDLQDRYGGMKPCLHGCDAHQPETVGVPDGDRYSWVKGGLEFDALRQACIDPAGRAFVGPEPPMRATPSQVISEIKVSDAPWLKTPELPLNPGLVAIIGARGSGKTALVEMIATGCDAVPENRSNQASFLVRAGDLLDSASAQLAWETGNPVNRRLDGSDGGFSSQYPRARYLSQQFVEDLCHANGMTDALLREMERVIFDSHSSTDTDGATNFQELLDMRATRYRQARHRQEETLAQLSERIGTELDKDKSIPDLKLQITQKEELLKGYVVDRHKLVSKGSEARVARLNDLEAAAEKIRGYLRVFSGQQQALLALEDEVKDMRARRAPEMLRQSQEQHVASGIKGEDWNPFLLDYKGDVNTALKAQLTAVQSNAATLKGSHPEPANDEKKPLIADDAELEKQPLALLDAEIKRLEKQVSIDRDTAGKFAAISKRITDETAALAKLRERLEDCEKAKARAAELVKEREETYAVVFQAILDEQNVLVELYRPLMDRLAASQGTLKNLSFTVERVADIEQWARAGEALLDLRKQGPFKGRGTLQQIAKSTLKGAWEVGGCATVTEAMKLFRSEYESELLERAPFSKADQADYRAWTKRFARWLYGTEHITIRYSIDYEGVDIRKLSPGTRGIVLLLLYLALDDADDRPLIIDQPEENLDPKSIFDELVNLFIEAKSKRQVIMVTHNANLVVNTDADQIIVAEAGPHPPNELPPISYFSGGLENADIRKAVCNILEGGEQAFRERARRLRVRFDR